MYHAWTIFGSLNFLKIVWDGYMTALAAVENKLAPLTIT